MHFEFEGIFGLKTELNYPFKPKIFGFESNLQYVELWMMWYWSFILHVLVKSQDIQLYVCCVFYVFYHHFMLTSTETGTEDFVPQLLHNYVG